MTAEDESTGASRLATELGRRREDLQLSYQAVSRRGGPSGETVRMIERQARPTFRAVALSQLDTALAWKPGIAKQIVAGTAPASRKDWEADYSPEEAQQRVAAARRRTRDPQNMAVLPVSLDNVSDMDLASEVVKRVGRGGNRALMELLHWAARFGDDDRADTTAAAS